MNVKVCTFPDGEDPDSFAKKTSHDDLLAYLKNEDFISSKRHHEKNDPMLIWGILISKYLEFNVRFIFRNVLELWIFQNRF
jgi:hypothetical protein